MSNSLAYGTQPTIKRTHTNNSKGSNRRGGQGQKNAKDQPKEELKEVYEDVN